MTDTGMPASSTGGQDAAAYDAWYDSPIGRSILATEIAALRPLVEAFPQPRLEIGVGTGRFAELLGARFGLDPSREALMLARRRGILVASAVGEAVPFVSRHFGAVLIAFTLCFLTDPAAVFRETRRLLADGGGLVIGFLPRGTPWADLYALRAARGHRRYRHARFYAVAELEQFLADSGFRVIARRCTLHQPPGLARYDIEAAHDGIEADASFAVISAVDQSRSVASSSGFHRVG
jgi:SAM-dependent methyltransferase